MSTTRIVSAVICSSCRQLSRLRGRQSYVTQPGVSNTLLSFKAKPQILIPCRKISDSISESPSTNVADYPAEVEVSYEAFKYVEPLLPKTTVPEIPDHLSYPTPSGWIPPNDEVRSQQPYLVRRTKNHVLPIYPSQREVWSRMMHHVTIKNIEGDIWKLESELRHYLQENIDDENVITQVHEVSRCVRVRGQHIATIAEFLMEKGM